MMLDLNKSNGPRPKCYFTHSSLPAYVDHEQPSTKKKPFSTVLSKTFNHTLDVVLPKEAAQRLQQAVAGEMGTLRYAKVYMKLRDVVEGDFFNEYIKSGNILMLSEGRPGFDHIYSLADGILRLEVNKPTYERMGLEGRLIPSEGRKHVKARFAIEINLRLPSMVRGKKGFDRIVWAFDNVLDRSVAWLFCNMQMSKQDDGPLAVHQPIFRAVDAAIEHFDDVFVPTFPQAIDEDEQLETIELLEWLTLVMSGSPRVQRDDKFDTFLSRYSVPDQNGDLGDHSTAPAHDLTRFHWHGLIPTAFITKILLAALKASGTDWFTLSVQSFAGEAYTVLKTDNKTLTWEYMN